MKHPKKDLWLAIALLVFGYLFLWIMGPQPQILDKPNLDEMTVEEFLKHTSVNINHATREELMELPGIGTALADAILEYREEHGPFTSWDELEAVPGLGPEKLDAIKIYLDTL